jgi:hypothetical protein
MMIMLRMNFRAKVLPVPQARCRVEIRCTRTAVSIALSSRVRMLAIISQWIVFGDASLLSSISQPALAPAVLKQRSTIDVSQAFPSPTAANSRCQQKRKSQSRCCECMSRCRNAEDALRSRTAFRWFKRSDSQHSIFKQSKP